MQTHTNMPETINTYRYLQHTENNIQSPIILYTVKDIQNIFKCSIKHAYELVNANGFPSFRIGKKILVEKKALEQWLDKNKGKQIIL